MADFWNAFRTGQEGREHWQNRNVRREQREAAEAQIPAVRERYGDTSGGNPTTAVSLAENDREQQKFDAERMRRGALAALTAYRSITSDIPADTPEEEIVGVREAMFDRVAGGLMAAGADEEQLGQLRSILVSNPEAADALIAGIQQGDNSRANYAPRAVIDPETGQPVFVAPGQEVGRVAADQYLSQGRLSQGVERLDISRGMLKERIRTNDPDYQESRAEAIAGGRAAGEAAASIPVIEQAAREMDAGIDRLLNDPDLAAITGIPSVASLSRGGLGGNLPPIPGTPAAAALAALRRTAGQVRLQAYNTLKGGGHITEIESEFAAEASAALARAQSYEDLVAAIELLRTEINQRIEAARAAAVAPRRRAREAAAPAAPASRGGTGAAPRGSLRQEGEDVDDLLGRLGF